MDEEHGRGGDAAEEKERKVKIAIESTTKIVELELAGGAIRIVWSRFDNPTVSAVNSDGTTTLLGTYILKDTEQQRFAMDDYQRWEIANFGVELMGEVRGAVRLAEPAFDPSGARMRT